MGDCLVKAMNTISITEEDGSDPLPICRDQREWLIARYKLEAIIALKFFSDDMPVAEADETNDTKAIDHIRKCPRCREWIHRVIPNEAVALDAPPGTILCGKRLPLA